MSRFELTKTRLANGAWEGVLTQIEGSEGEPNIRVMHRDQSVDGVELTADNSAGGWAVKIPVPKHAIADGVQTFVVFDAESDTKLGDFSLMAGEAMADDMRAEMELLRAELDMLKRAFRRHCLETT